MLSRAGGLGSCLGGCSHCPAAPCMVQPLWASSSDKRRKRDTATERQHTEESRTAPRIPWQHLGRAARTSPPPSSKEGTNNLSVQTGPPPCSASEDRLGGGQDCQWELSFCCPTSPQSHGGAAWAEGKVLSSVGFPAEQGLHSCHEHCLSSSLRIKKK